MQTTVARFQGARYVAPWMQIRGGSNLQEAQSLFFGTGNPEVEFMPAIATKTGPTTAFSTTTEARQWDQVVNSFLLLEKMHENQKFPLLLSPFELAQGMTFTTRIFTSNLDPPEEAPEHVPAPFSTTQWSETKTVLKLVHRSVKFSQHELKTAKGQQDYKVHLENLGLMFLRDVHACILRKFARQTTVLTALSNMYPPSAQVNRDLMHNVVRSFGQLNCEATGLDTLVNNVKQIGTLNNVEFDTCVVPYGSLANLALNPNNFILTETAVTLARDLAKMADISTPAKVPTHLFQNNMSVFQYQRTAEQMQNPRADPMTNTAILATYHPFGNDRVYIPGSRDIQIVSTETSGWATLRFHEAILNLGLSAMRPAGKTRNVDHAPHGDRESSVLRWSQGACDYFGQCSLSGDNGNTETYVHIVNNLKTAFPHVASFAKYVGVECGIEQIATMYENGNGFRERADHETSLGVAEWNMDAGLSAYILPWVNEILPLMKTGGTNWPCHDSISSWNARDIDRLYLALFMMLPCDVTSVVSHLDRGIDFPFEVVAIRPWIEVETSNAIFCKRGRETAVTYCLPPWTFIGRDNRIEMLDMKFGFWRECHIERPANILVAEHAFVNRVVKGMTTEWMPSSGGNEPRALQYLKEPMRMNEMGSVYAAIVGPITNSKAYPVLAPILTHNVYFQSPGDRLNPMVEGSRTNQPRSEFADSYDISRASTKGAGGQRRGGVLAELSDIWRHAPSPSVTLWNGEEIQHNAIPRLASLGTTQQQVVEVGMNGDKQVPIRIKNGTLLQNRGHMKKLDSPEWIGSLCGFAQSQIGTPAQFF